MQRRANQKYLLFALLPLFIIAAALWACGNKNYQPSSDIAVTCVSKTIASSQRDVPLVSNEVYQVSKAEHRSPHKHQVTTLCGISDALGFVTNSNNHITVYNDNYSCLFKILFPELEFS